jgi:hypothetical protein
MLCPAGGHPPRRRGTAEGAAHHTEGDQDVKFTFLSKWTVLLLTLVAGGLATLG